MPQWLAREYLARRGNARFRPEQLTPARCPLLGYAMRNMQVEGTVIAHWFLETQTQPEVGVKGYDAGAEILTNFFKRELPKYLAPDLDPLGKEIIECCLAGGSLEDYEGWIEQEIFLKVPDRLRVPSEAPHMQSEGTEELATA